MYYELLCSAYGHTESDSFYIFFVDLENYNFHDACFD